jgi:hypothetical protein
MTGYETEKLLNVEEAECPQNIFSSCEMGSNELRAIGMNIILFLIVVGMCLKIVLVYKNNDKKMIDEKENT